jgi:hypothetical protein
MCMLLRLAAHGRTNYRVFIAKSRLMTASR